MFRFWPWLATALSGVLLTLGFPRWDQAWLCWVALAPVIAAIWFGGGPQSCERRTLGMILRSLWRPALLGYTTGIVYFWGSFYWLTTVTGLGWFLLPFYLALFPAGWGAFVGLIRPCLGDFRDSGRNLAVALACAAAWVGQEWVRGWLFTGFGWNGIGIALHANVWMIQIVEYTGVGGLSFLIVLANFIGVITVKRFVEEARARRVRPHWDFSVTMALIAGVLAYGIRTVAGPPPVKSGQPLRVAMVQPNIPQVQKYDAEFERTIFEKYAYNSNIALGYEPQLLIWPEAATPGGIYSSQKNFDFAYDFARRTDNFLLGTLDYDIVKRCDYNVAALFTKGRKVPQMYRKMHLVPFGEYVPFRHSFPFFAWVMGDLVPGDLTPGSEPVVLRMKAPAVRVGALVCFEDTLGDLTRRFVQNGAQILVNITNDSWFLKSAGAEQHLANAVFRAVENRRPLLRGANTGVTAIVNPLGQITHDLRAPDGTTFFEGVLTGVVSVPTADAQRTFYTEHGELFSLVCAVAAIGLCPFLIWRARK